MVVPSPALFSMVAVESSMVVVESSKVKQRYRIVPSWYRGVLYCYAMVRQRNVRCCDGKAQCGKGRVP